MAIFGLFGGKKNSEAQKGEFFLDFEEAQTLGNTEYMKQSKTIKHTFPKLKGRSSGKTIVTQVSAESMRNVNPNQVTSSASSTGSAESFAAPAPTMSSSRPNLKVDSSMDMFRNMAKKINR